VRGEAPDCLSGRAAHRFLAGTRAQPYGPGLFARTPA
jgi:hypothetical protein